MQGYAFDDRLYRENRVGRNIGKDVGMTTEISPEMMSERSLEMTHEGSPEMMPEKTLLSPSIKILVKNILKIPCTGRIVQTKT